jgi:3-deoxy-7-phosphoheptulonate synthase
MMIVMKPTATEEDILSVIDRIESCGAKAHPSRGEEVTVIGAVGDREHVQRLNLEQHQGVEQVVPILKPYKLSSRQFAAHGERTVIEIDGRRIGGEHFSMIAGPCTVESRDQLLTTARIVKDAGGSLLRGGAYKPRTSPYAFQGLGVDGLRILAQVSKETGLPVVTEIMDPADVDVVAEHADMFQIGTRNMQNFPLLQAVGAAGKPVMLKRGLTATYEEWLMAAEYIAQRGNLDIVLCERGIRGFEPTIRNMLDVSAIPMVHAHSHLPVIVDPSHAAGRRDLVLPLARAGMAAGADGVMVDVHPEPERALCDGAQALSGDLLDELTVAVATIPPLLGRRSAVTAERVHPSR